MKNTDKRTALRLYGLAFCACAILIVLFVNLIAGLIPNKFKRFDMSTSKLTEISDAAAKLIKAVDKNVTIYYICETGNVDETIRTFVDNYADKNSKITVEEVDPVLRPSFISSVTNNEYTTLTDNCLILTSGDTNRHKVVAYHELYTVNIYSDGTLIAENMSMDDFQNNQSMISYYGYTYELMFAGEGAITTALDYVAAEALPKAYNITGHGEDAIPSSIRSSFIADNIELADINLSTVEKIPSDASMVIMNVPETDLSESEKAVLSEYLSRGGNLFISTYFAYTNGENLSSLLAEYGMRSEEGYLSETKVGYYYTSYQGANRAILVPNTDGASSLLGVDNLSAYLLGAQSIIKAETDKDITFTPLFKTSDKCERLYEDAKVTQAPVTEAAPTSSAPTTEVAPITEAPVTHEPIEDEESIELASVYGQYYPAVWVSADGENAPTNIMWVSTPYFIDYSDTNNTYFLKAVHKMCNKESSVSLATKATEDASYVSFDKSERIAWTLILTVVIPIAMIALGVSVTLKRRRR